MKRRTDHELLADVLAESAPPDFRAASLAKTLRTARRRRQMRQARSVAGILCAAILLAIFAGNIFLKSSDVSAPQIKTNPKSSYELVCTQPLPGKFHHQHETICRSKFDFVIGNGHGNRHDARQFPLHQRRGIARAGRGPTGDFNSHRTGFGRIGFRQRGRSERVSGELKMKSGRAKLPLCP